MIEKVHGEAGVYSCTQYEHSPSNSWAIEWDSHTNQFVFIKCPKYQNIIQNDDRHHNEKFHAPSKLNGCTLYQDNILNAAGNWASIQDMTLYLLGNSPLPKPILTML